MQRLRTPFARLSRLSVMLVVIAAVFAGGLGLGTGLLSAGAQPGGEIHGCVNNFTGKLRITAGSGQCSQTERPLNWNQQGPSGLLDIQLVREDLDVVAADQTNRARIQIECPAGYRVIGGGAGLGNSFGNDIWTMTYNGPLEAGQSTNTNDAWLGIFRTVDNQDADGNYGFSATAVCALTG